MRQHTPSISDEKGEERILSGGEFDVFFPLFHTPRCQIDLQVMHRECRRIKLRGTMPQCVADTREEFAGPEWLGQIVVGTGVKTCYDIVFRVADGEDQNGDL